MEDETTDQLCPMVGPPPGGDHHNSSGTPAVGPPPNTDIHNGFDPYPSPYTDSETPG